METDVDRVLVYVTLYIIECLKRLQKLPNVERATQDMFSAALEPFSIPGEAGFPLNAFYSKPQGSEAEEMKKYLVQVRGHILISSYLVILFCSWDKRQEPGWQRRCLIPPCLVELVQPSGGHAGLRESSSTWPWIRRVDREQECGLEFFNIFIDFTDNAHLCKKIFS